MLIEFRIVRVRQLVVYLHVKIHVSRDQRVLDLYYRHLSVYVL